MKYEAINLKRWGTDRLFPPYMPSKLASFGEYVDSDSAILYTELLIK